VAHDFGLFGLSAIALAAAGVLALGAFGFTDHESPAGFVSRSTERPLVAVSNAPVAPVLLTYYLVSSEEQQALMYAAENQMWNREYLQKSKLEVIVARNLEEEEAAYREIAAARVRSSLTRVVVEDLRAR
jgi:hypothetical protein